MEGSRAKQGYFLFLECIRLPLVANRRFDNFLPEDQTPKVNLEIGLGTRNMVRTNARGIYQEKRGMILRE
jgi:hypothetical protein